MLATATFQQLVFCLAEGMALAMVVSSLLRLAPGRDSRTRFRLRFAALLATAALPLFTAGWRALDWRAFEWRSFDWRSLPGMASVSQFVSQLSLPQLSVPPLNFPQSVVSLPVAIVEWACLAWLASAAVGMLRVGFGLRQISRLKRSCQNATAEQLGPELAARVADFNRVRQVRVLVSRGVNVPAAVGFFRPAIVLPPWLVAEGPSDELKHVLLHELEHLRRFDDWTNLAQQMVKAILFFHPAVWWMERELSLDREMACDDAVLAQTNSPRVYAQCLARVAEKSFLRRQIALAQAAVSRARQLSHRVARILDPARPEAAGLWKPAVPVVAAFAVLCALSLSWTPGLIAVNNGGVFAKDDATTFATVSAANPTTATGLMKAQAQSNDASIKSAGPLARSARVTTADLKQDSYLHAVALPAALHATSAPATSARVKAVEQSQAKQKPVLHSQTMAEKVTAEKDRIADRAGEVSAAPPEQIAALDNIVSGLRENARAGNAPSAPDRKSVAIHAEAEGDFVLVVATQRTVTQGPSGVQVNVVQVRLLVPASEFRKQFPNKI